MKFVDLFAGLGGFHVALASLGHECVFAAEIDPELRHLYGLNFPTAKRLVFGDIRLVRSQVPEHDILCAGFPCQPFSKSGSQNGLNDLTRGTLFHEILAILAARRPQYVLLENVGNFERHDEGRTWSTVRESLIGLGYDVRGTTHVTSGGHGLISPHHLGHPHTRERFYVVAALQGLPPDPFPVRDRKRVTSLEALLQREEEISQAERDETRMSARQIDCVNHWNKLLSLLPEASGLPSFPIWGDEVDATYPFEEETPFAALSNSTLVDRAGDPQAMPLCHEDALQLLPSYARRRDATFPKWKVGFIRSNRDWFRSIGSYVPGEWFDGLRKFPPSLRKLEWNCQGEERDLWRHVLQFRPSGLRVKRFTSCPALVAMTVTQIPVLGPRRRFITRTEGLRLQGFPDSHLLPRTRAAAFAALGNAVHTKVVGSIAERFLPTSSAWPHSAE